MCKTDSREIQQAKYAGDTPKSLHADIAENKSKPSLNLSIKNSLKTIVKCANKVTQPSYLFVPHYSPEYGLQVALLCFVALSKIKLGLTT